MTPDGREANLHAVSGTFVISFDERTSAASAADELRTSGFEVDVRIGRTEGAVVVASLKASDRIDFEEAKTVGAHDRGGSRRTRWVLLSRRHVPVRTPSPRIERDLELPTCEVTRASGGWTPHSES